MDVLTDKESGAALRMVRIEKNIKQEAMAKLMNISRYKLSRIETGKAAISLPMLIAFCEAIGISVVDIINILEKI